LSSFTSSSADSITATSSTSSNASTKASNNKALGRPFRMTCELLGCSLVSILGYKASVYLRPLLGHTMRPIPYQKLSSGEVILDFQLNHPWKQDVTFPGPLLIHSCFTLPFIFLVVFTLAVPMTKPRFIDTHAAICVLLLSIGISEFVTQACKIYVGRLRPNFYSLCDFDTSTLECAASYEHILESRSSFPSGHSSFSMSGMGVICWFLLGRVGLGIQHTKQNAALRLSLLCLHQNIVILISCIPLLYSVLIGCSRLVDNWHHPSDIIAGFIIGLICPTLSYHLWYVIGSYLLTFDIFCAYI
jgi:membrane-associated phospholipid phosphatase